MDLSGSNENYFEDNRIFKVFKLGQVIDFGVTVFANSIHVYYLSGGISDQELILNTDYEVTDELIADCDNDMSSCKLMDPNFNETLCHGIRMKQGVEYGASYTIAVSYQRLYPSQIRTAYIHSEPLNVTPELMVEVIRSIEQLKVLTHDVTDVSSLTTPGSILLEVDESKSNPDNYITDEVHTVNVPNAKFVIHPKGGSFYYDSVTVKHPASGQTLVLGTDYFIEGMDESKTKATSHTAPVYNFILIVSQIVGDLEVSYHAYGGDPTLDNYRELLLNMNNVVKYLNEAKTVTEDTLGSTEVISSLCDRIAKLESNMRRLQGLPSYGDITYGNSILMKLFSEQPGLHWYTIASLYTITGESVSPCTADTFKFRFQSLHSHIQFTATVSVDLSNTDNNKFNVNVTAENYPRGFIPFEDYATVDQIIIPQLRIVWNESTQASGIYLQLGFELKGMLEETVSIEDLSGHESCWKLVEEKTTSTTPQDSDFLLPSGNHTWSELLSTSKEEQMMLPFRQGHLIWAGSKSLNRPIEGWQHFEISDELLIAHTTNIRKFTGIRLDIEEVNGFKFPVDLRFNPGTEHLKGHATFTHQNNPAYINAEVYRENDKIMLRLNYDITAGLSASELLLRDVVVLLDI